MGKVKEWAYDLAEQTIDDTIEKIIKNELSFNKAVKLLKEDKKVNVFFSDDENILFKLRIFLPLR